MRFLLALLAFLALAVGPLSVPAQAAVVSEHCAGADMQGMGHDAPDESGAAKLKSCCVVAVATVDGSSVEPAVTLPRATLKAARLMSLAGMRGDVEVPPPRT